MSATLADNFAAVRERIAAATARSGRTPDAARLVAVSKTVDVDTVRRAVSQADQHLFGENRADELVRKMAACPDECFHFIGSLQSNKVRQVVGRATLIHSVDSEHLLRKIEERARFLGITQEVLLQVNVSGEQSKHGFAPAELDRLSCECVPGLKHVQINGLMTMAPIASPEALRWVFEGLRELARSVDRPDIEGWSMRELSAGMSGDFEIALEEGATLVRIGTALFRE